MYEVLLFTVKYSESEYLITSVVMKVELVSEESRYLIINTATLLSVSYVAALTTA